MLVQVQPDRPSSQSWPSKQTSWLLPVGSRTEGGFGPRLWGGTTGRRQNVGVPPLGGIIVLSHWLASLIPPKGGTPTLRTRNRPRRQGRFENATCVTRMG